MHVVEHHHHLQLAGKTSRSHNIECIQSHICRSSSSRLMEMRQLIRTQPKAIGCFSRISNHYTSIELISLKNEMTNNLTNDGGGGCAKTVGKKPLSASLVSGIEMIANFICLKAWTCWKRIKFQNHKVFLSTSIFYSSSNCCCLCRCFFFSRLLSRPFSFSFLSAQFLCAYRSTESAKFLLSNSFFGLPLLFGRAFLEIVLNSFKFIQAKWLVC